MMPRSVLQALERDVSSDTDSVEARSTTSEGPNDSEREDECSEAASDDLPFAELEPDPPSLRPSAVAMRAGLPQLDMVDLRRGGVMTGVPRFLWGSFRIALKLALEEIAAGSVVNDRLIQERGGNYYSSFHGCFSIAPPREDKDVGSFPEVLGGAEGRPPVSRLLLLPGNGEDARSLDWTSGCRELFIWCNWVHSPVGDRPRRVQIWPFGTTATLNALRDPQKRPPRPRGDPRDSTPQAVGAG